MNNTTAYIERLRDRVTAFLDAFEDLQGLSLQYTYLAYGTNMAEEDVHPPDTDINQDIELADIQAAVATLTALKTAMDNEHGTNLYTIRR